MYACAVHMYLPYSGRIWQGLKFGDLASNWKLTKFNSSPNIPPFIHYSGHSASYYMHGTVQVPVEDELFIYQERTPRQQAGKCGAYCNPPQLHSNRASKHWVLPLGKGPPYWLSPGRSQLIRMFAESGCPYRTVSMIPTSVSIAIYDGTVGHLNN